MNGLLSIADKAQGPAIDCLGLLGLIVLVILMILALARKEHRASQGIGLGLIIFLILLAMLEAPAILKARFSKPKPVETRVAAEQPAQPEIPPQPAATVEQPAPAPAPPVLEQPKPVEKPKPAPAPVAVPAPPPPKPTVTIVQEQPKPAAVPTPAAPPPPAPKPKPVEPPPVARTAPGGGHRMAVSANPAGTGRIDIEIRGPILETAKSQAPAAHLMIILDNEHALIIPPTRYTEQKKENEFGEQVTSSVTYFWEGIQAGFDNVAMGPHSIMIDFSLESPQTHKAKMVGAENLQNDFNGFAQVPEGAAAQMVFGTKNWMTQELERIR